MSGENKAPNSETLKAAEVRAGQMMGYAILICMAASIGAGFLINTVVGLLVVAIWAAMYVGGSFLILKELRAAKAKEGGDEK